MGTKPPKLPPIQPKFDQRSLPENSSSLERIKPSNSYTLGIDGNNLKVWVEFVILFVIKSIVVFCSLV